MLDGTVFVGGAAVMVLEIMGTRSLAPVFGAGLFVWAALLTVTLCALAAGYYAGGALADRRPVARSLGVTLAGAALALGLSVLCAPPVLRWGLSHGPRAGSFATALLLFAPALVALGMVGPIAVRLATTDVALAGHRVGRTYAVSTAGSLVGTLAVVFVLIPAFETDLILLGTVGVLCLSSAVWLSGREGSAALALAALLAAAATKSQRDLPRELTIVERSQSHYGLLEVIDDRARGIRLLRSDHSILGGQSRRDGTSAFAYVHALEGLRFIRPETEEMLQIGLGIGALSMAMQRRGVRSDVVEIDPEIVRLAKAHFGYVPSGEIFVQDARAFLNRTTRKYGLIVHDTFTGGVTPAHLLSREVFERVQKALRPGGVLVVNFPGFATGAGAQASRSVAATLRSVFETVRVFRDSPPAGDTPKLANLLFFASDEAMDFAVPKDTTFENSACLRTLTRFARWEVIEQAQSAAIVTDARNPLTRMQVEIAEEHYRAMAKLLPLEAWLPW